MHVKSYLQYWWHARYHNGHGVHSPFMYDFTRNMLCKKRRKGEEKDKQKRIIARFTSFCTGYSLQLLEIKSEMDLASLSENVLAYLRYPHEDDVLWLKLANHPATRVSVDIYTLGIVFTLPKLQKQRYCIRL